MNYERILRQLRNSPKLFAADSTKIDRVLQRVKARFLKQREQEDLARKRNQPRGPYSGLTRAELLATGTCEPDWY